MIADLHPTHDTETTPIFWQAMLAHNRTRIVADVQKALDWTKPTPRTEPRVNRRLVSSREAQARAALRVVHDSRYTGVGVLRAVAENA